MLDLNMNSAITTHVDRIKPQMSVDSSGRVIWMPNLTDYNADVFYRGRKVTNEEFNTLFLQGVYQSNYITDSLTEFFTNHLGTAVYREFTAAFNLAPSYVKTFDIADWGTLQDDGFYYITIPVSEHGFVLDENTQANTMNIDTEMYLLDEATGKFFEVDQIETAEDNTVTLYTDDNTLSGFVVIRTNDKAYALTAPTIDATQVTGLASVAISARYTDLIDINAADGPNSKINKNTTDILNILNGDSIVARAYNANNADTATALLGTSTIQGIPVSNLFVPGSNYTYNALNATNAENATNALNATNAENATNALNATNVIINNDSANTRNGFKNTSTTVYGNDGLLTIDEKPYETIIARKIVLWSGNTDIRGETGTSVTINYTTSLVPSSTGIIRVAYSWWGSEEDISYAYALGSNGTINVMRDNGTYARYEMWDIKTPIYQEYATFTLKRSWNINPSAGITNAGSGGITIKEIALIKE